MHWYHLGPMASSKFFQQFVSTFIIKHLVKSGIWGQSRGSESWVGNYSSVCHSFIRKRVQCAHVAGLFTVPGTWAKACKLLHKVRNCTLLDLLAEGKRV